MPGIPGVLTPSWDLCRPASGENKRGGESRVDESRWITDTTERAERGEIWEYSAIISIFDGIV